MPTILEPIAAGVIVAAFNKYILNKLDPFGFCYATCCQKEDGDDCTSSSSTSVVDDAAHVHHF